MMAAKETARVVRDRGGSGGECEWGATGVGADEVRQARSRRE